MAKKKAAATKPSATKAAKQTAAKGVTQKSQRSKWRTYEEVAQQLLNMFAQDFGVDFFQDKQKVKGTKTGTTWQIDAKGANIGSTSFIVVECRRFGKNQRQSQAKLAELAYVIMDSGASGGIMVSPYNLQSGAEFVAKAEKIETVILTPDSTAESFCIEFVDKLKILAGMPISITGK